MRKEKQTDNFSFSYIRCPLQDREGRACGEQILCVPHTFGEHYVHRNEVEGELVMNKDRETNVIRTEVGAVTSRTELKLFRVVLVLSRPRKLLVDRQSIKRTLIRFHKRRTQAGKF